MFQNLTIGDKMKVKIESVFHNTSDYFTIKDYFKHDTIDCLALLKYEIYSDGMEKRYAENKLKEIKTGLCGQKNCNCVFKVIV